MRDLFGKIGIVETARVVQDPASGLSQGYGFVHYATQADARRAMRELDGTPIMGQAIRVRARAARRGAMEAAPRVFARKFPVAAVG